MNLDGETQFAVHLANMINNIIKFLGCVLIYLIMSTCVYMQAYAYNVFLKILTICMNLLAFYLIFYPRLKKSWKKIIKKQRQENPDILDDIKF